MPSYPGASGSSTLQTSAVALAPGDYQYLFGVLAASATQLPVNDTNVIGETPVNGQASIAVTSTGDLMGEAPQYTIEVEFDVNPGVFSLVIQESDTDRDVSYITPGSPGYTISTATQQGAVWVAREDLIPAAGKYQRVKWAASPANATKAKVKITKAG